MRDILPIYKKLLRLAKNLPVEKRENAINKIRTEFRNYKGVSDQKEISQLLQKAQSSIGYLKIVTPKNSSDKGVKRYIYRNGSREEGKAVEEEGAKYKTIDMDAVYRRHDQLLRRQHFMDRKAPPPRSLF